MSLQLINLGTPPKGVDGDTQRTANQKMNENVQYLDSTKLSKQGGTVAGALRVAYSHPWAGVTIDNTSGTTTFLNFDVAGVSKGGVHMTKQGDQYVLSLLGTPNDSPTDNRQGLMTLTRDACWTQAYGMLHDYFIKKNTTEAIKTIGEGWTNGAIVESQGFASEIRGRGVQLFIREVLGQYAESVVRTYVDGAEARDFLFRYNGNAYAPGSWLNASDIRLKDDITPLAGMRALLAQIQPIHYTMHGQDSIGYSAQELQHVLPDCVHIVGDTIDKDGNEIKDSLAVNYSALTAFNTQILKEQERIICKLLERVRQLEIALGAHETA